MFYFLGGLILGVNLGLLIFSLIRINEKDK